MSTTGTTWWSASARSSGGLQLGATFFGWLSAMGMAVLLTALLAAVGAAVGLGTGTTVEEAAEQAQQRSAGPA